MYLTLLVIIDNNIKSHLVAQYLSKNKTIKVINGFLVVFFK
jgi:hypothetical protein